MRIVFLDRDTIGPGIAMRRPGFAHEWVEYGKTAPDQVVERLQEAEIAVTNKVRIGRAALAGLPELRMIAVAATGVASGRSWSRTCAAMRPAPCPSTPSR